MKRSAPGRSCAESSLLASATRDEILVTEILLDLRNRICSLSESLSDFNWGRRRKRSCLDAPPPLPPAPSRLSTSVQKKAEVEIEVRKPLVKPEAAEDEKCAGDAVRITSSPDTPLSFSPCESDEKSNRPSKKASRKRSREELFDKIEELTQRKLILLGEIENVKKYYDSLKTYNSQLKAKKKEVLKTCPGKGDCQLEVPQPFQRNALSYQPPLIEDPTVQKLQSQFGPNAARFHAIGSVNRVGPITIPLGIDLNIPAEEPSFEVDSSRPLDANVMDKRARCAEARRRRRGLIKIKAIRNACGIKLPAGR
ncbi:uncharacterized protein LOC127265153 [Andrographis paniculata]|uniref:uncharacterized protein LOC127265153 n=1 Tax=Andrographis paniculata TaxID=175694 RepID=UPI0021E81AEA|nr:uncharacterized protein LOC127265153 [Andrographis paniculata]